MSLLTQLLERLPRSQDLAVACVLLLAIALMILPMPTLVVDILIAFNLGIALLILMTALYLTSPLELSTLPGVILISTIFRLALSVTTTRLILSEGDAGAIIRTFGEFVIAGSVVVGLVIFFIITIVQLVVIAKGSERVAEVGARFTLDALPGKQMAIDADLRNGDIDQAEAKRRRDQLGRESQLYGAMDGAMKFVKGDAMAGIIIILVNLIGGVIIGSVQRGLPFGEALRTYSLLTVGDALISQIPALLLSLAASVVVTRVASERDQNLGRDIATQLSSDFRPLLLSGGLLALMGLLPGFPTITMLVLGGTFCGIGAVRWYPQMRAARKAAEPVREPGEDGEEAGAADPQEAAPADEPHTRITVRLPKDLAASERLASLKQRLSLVQGAVTAELGLPLPAVGVRADGTIEGRADIEIDRVVELSFPIDPATLVLTSDPRDLTLLEIEPQEKPPLRPGDRPLLTFSAEHRELARGHDVGFLEWDEQVLRAADTLLRTRAAEFLGIQETRNLLEPYEVSHNELLKEVVRTSSLQRIADVLRRLLEEHVPIANMRAILEALAAWSERERDVVLLSEYVRAALKRQISRQHANADGLICCVLVARDVEEKIRGALRETAVGTYLVLDERTSDALIKDVRERMERALDKGERMTRIGQAPFVLLTTMDVRRYLRSLLARNGVDVPVLSHQELAPGTSTLPVGSLDLRGAGARGQAEPVA